MAVWYGNLVEKNNTNYNIVCTYQYYTSYIVFIYIIENYNEILITIIN